MVFLSFSSISGNKFRLNIDPNMTPRETSRIICKQLGIPNTPIQFFYNDNLIHSSTTFSQLKVTDDSIIFYRIPPKEKQFGISRTSSSSIQNPSERIHFSITPDLIELVNQSVDPRTQRYYTNYDNTIQHEKHLKNRDPKHMDELVKKLVLMGYDEKTSKNALRNNRYNIEMAVESLINSSDNSSSDPFGFSYRRRFREPDVFQLKNSPYKKYAHDMDNNESSFTYSPDEIQQVDTSLAEEEQKLRDAENKKKSIRENMEEILSQIPVDDGSMRREIEQETANQISKINREITTARKKIEDLSYKQRCMREHKDYRNPDAYRRRQMLSFRRRYYYGDDMDPLPSHFDEYGDYRPFPDDEPYLMRFRRPVEHNDDNEHSESPFAHPKNKNPQTKPQPLKDKLIDEPIHDDGSAEETLSFRMVFEDFDDDPQPETAKNKRNQNKSCKKKQPNLKPTKGKKSGQADNTRPKSTPQQNKEWSQQKKSNQKPKYQPPRSYSNKSNSGSNEPPQRKFAESRPPRSSSQLRSNESSNNSEQPQKRTSKWDTYRPSQSSSQSSTGESSDRSTGSNQKRNSSPKWAPYKPYQSSSQSSTEESSNRSTGPKQKRGFSPPKLGPIPIPHSSQSSTEETSNSSGPNQKRNSPPHFSFSISPPKHPEESNSVPKAPPKNLFKQIPKPIPESPPKTPFTIGKPKFSNNDNTKPKPNQPSNPNPPQNEPSSPPRQDSRNQVDILQQELDDDTRRVLRDIASQNNISFYEVCQLYLIADRDIEITRQLLQ